jgi:hypothetical protein
MSFQKQVESFIATSAIIAAQLIELNDLKEKLGQMEAGLHTSRRNHFPNSAKSS